MGRQKLFHVALNYTRPIILERPVGEQVLIPAGLNNVRVPDKNTHNAKLRNDVNRVHTCGLLSNYNVSVEFRLDAIHQYILRPILRVVK